MEKNKWHEIYKIIKFKPGDISELVEELCHLRLVEPVRDVAQENHSWFQVVLVKLFLLPLAFHLMHTKIILLLYHKKFNK